MKCDHIQYCGHCQEVIAERARERIEKAVAESKELFVPLLEELMGFYTYDSPRALNDLIERIAAARDAA